MIHWSVFYCLKANLVSVLVPGFKIEDWKFKKKFKQLANSHLEVSVSRIFWEISVMAAQKKQVKNWSPLVTKNNSRSRFRKKLPQDNETLQNL